MNTKSESAFFLTEYIVIYPLLLLFNILVASLGKLKLMLYTP